jgi:hypothetical protein
MCAPIFQCPNGHLVCETCKKKLSVCPTCKLAYSSVEIRNRGLEKLAETLIEPCKHGCGEQLSRPARKEHEEKNCTMRPYTCPTIGSECDYKSRSAQDIANHMVSCHEAKSFQSNEIDMTITNTQSRAGNLVWQRVHSYHGLFVLLTVERHEHQGKERFSAYCRGIHDKERPLSYRIEVARFPRSLTWQGPVRSIREGKTEMRDSNDCLVLDSSMALFFSGGQGVDAKLQLRFRGTIFKRDTTACCGPYGKCDHCKAAAALFDSDNTNGAMESATKGQD